MVRFDEKSLSLHPTSQEWLLAAADDGVVSIWDIDVESSAYGALVKLLQHKVGVYLLGRLRSIGGRVYWWKAR